MDSEKQGRTQDTKQNQGQNDTHKMPPAGESGNPTQPAVKRVFRPLKPVAGKTASGEPARKVQPVQPAPVKETPKPQPQQQAAERPEAVPQPPRKAIRQAEVPPEQPKTPPVRQTQPQIRQAQPPVQARQASQQAPPPARRQAPPPQYSPRREEEDWNKRVQPYDWGRTAKFSLDQKKFLERVFRQFADNITTKMSKILLSNLVINFQGAKMRQYSQFIQGLYEPITIIVLRIDPENKGLMVLDFPMSSALIDRCLGGKGESLLEVRYFTEIETAVLERVTIRLIESYMEALSEIKECKPQFLEMEFNPQTVHIVKPSDMMVCVTFDVRLGQVQGPLHLAIPYDYMKSILPRSNFEEFMLTKSSQTQVNPSVAPLFVHNIERAKVPVSVELGSTELLFQDLAVLEIDDLIILDKDITKPLKIKVNDRVKFLGRPGVRNNKIAIQLTDVLKEGDEEYEE